MRVVTKASAIECVFPTRRSRSFMCRWYYFSNAAAGEEPAAKKQKVEGEDDLQGGMADLVKAKVTEVKSINII